jgi:adenine-specific DNA methylase
MPRLRPRPEVSGFVVPCPECGTSVPLIAMRWLAPHRETGTQYARPRTVRERCPGTFLAVGPTAAPRKQPRRSGTAERARSEPG